MYNPRLKQYISLILSVFIGSSGLLAQPFYQNDEAAEWADSLMANMTLDQKIGQLFMVAAYSNKDSDHRAELRELVEDYHLGGLIFFQGGPVRQARMTNDLQSKAKIPLMIGMDAEWDLAMRLDSVAKLPWPMTLGATNDSALAYAYGFTIATHCKRLGVHFNFGPVLDVNTNPDNPIIGVRAFGETPELVSKMGVAYMLGMQDAGVLACGKHFPGHGDTDEDSHRTLPTVDRSYPTLHDVDWMPYRAAIDHGLASVMIAHLNVPSLDRSGTPTSLSPIVVDSLLRKELGFQGLSFTDALNMRGVSDLYGPGEVDLRALLAGNDVLLFAEDVPAAFNKIKAAIQGGRLTEEEVAVHTRRILMAKHGAGLNAYEPINIENIYNDLNDRATDVTRSLIFDKAVTVVSNQDRLLPLDVSEASDYALIRMGSRFNDDLETAIRKYTTISTFDHTGGNGSSVLRDVATKDVVVLAYYTDDTNPWRRYKMNADQLQFIRRLRLQNKVVLVHFANPYGLKDIDDLEEVEAVIQAYQNTPEAANTVAQILFGGQEAKGRLPVSVGALMPSGHGIPTLDLHRLRYGHPEEVDMDPAFIARIDAEVQNAINKRATPGAQVLVARRGVVVMNKTYGKPTYDAREPVRWDQLYDIASITKIAATLPMIMKMYDEGRIDLEDELGDHLPETVGTNKEHLKLIDILTHQSGLQPWIPFYISTLSLQKPSESLYRDQREEGFNTQVADDLWIVDSYRDSIYSAILESPLNTSGEYKYSDLGYYFLIKVVENAYKAPIEDLIQEFLYDPIGAWSMGYRPLQEFDRTDIIPTEQDRYFRYQLVHGYVHDQGAAMLGGVGGHAGVFANANDLAKLMEVYLDYGEYAGQRFFRPTTLKQFTRCPYCINENRRGIGFDKPQLEGAGPACDCASPNSFGHTGFTGTIAWVDPDEELIYIFLSNRINPSAENRALISMDVRTNIQEIIYDSLL